MFINEKKKLKIFLKSFNKILLLYIYYNFKLHVLNE